MSVILRNIQIPLFIKIETDAFSGVQQMLDEHHLQFRKPLIISEEHILKRGGNNAVHALGDPATILTIDNSIANGDRIAAEIKEKGNDLLVGIGGGRVLDLVKYAATKARVNYVSMPTSPSNDGLCSPVAVLKNDEGTTDSINVNMPVGILVDTAMLTSAPIPNIQAGIGDLVSNFSAIHDWRLAYKEGQDVMDDFAASIAYSAAELIFETCRGTKVDVQSEEFLSRLVHGLILSGIAMNIAGSSRPCSGGEHKISHAIDALYPGLSMHGLQVAFGTLLASYMRGEDISHLVDFFASVDLPMTMEQLGLTREQLAAVIEKAPMTREGRYTILEEKKLNASQIEDLITTYHEHISELTTG